MVWVYGNSPSTSTEDGRRDAVRVLVGDTNTNDQQITDEEIFFALNENSKNVYFAAAQAARMVASHYARLVDAKFEGVSTDYHQRQEHYRKLAVVLDQQAKSKGGALGVPAAGGIRVDQVEGAKKDSNRVRSSFRRGQFSYPGADLNEDDDWYDYHN